jgi:tetratricopeptide (TPR) repeat protein
MALKLAKNAVRLVESFPGPTSPNVYGHYGEVVFDLTDKLPDSHRKQILNEALRILLEADDLIHIDQKKDYDRYVKDSEYGNYYFILGKISQRLEKWEIAGQAFKRAKYFISDHPAILAHLGWTLFQLEEPERAKKHIRRALEEEDNEKWEEWYNKVQSAHLGKSKE